MPEREFERQLEAARKDASVGTQFLFAYLGFHAVLSKNKEALDRVNQNSLFWKTIAGALQGEVFIALGRRFDHKSPYSLAHLLKLARENQQMFSLDALAARKRTQAGNADEWLPEFLAEAHVPTTADFKEMGRFAARLRATYHANYKDIRDKVMAHTEFVEDHDISALFGRTNIGEMANLFGGLRQINEVVWQLYNNGRQPEWNYQIALPDEILDLGIGKDDARTLEERIVAETAVVLTGLVDTAR